jgi:hypothetical protein
LWYNKGTKKREVKIMKIFAIMVLGTMLFMGCQALFRKIESAKIMRKMAKEKQALDKRIQQHLESKKYVTL